MIASVCGVIIAAVQPWTILATISTSGLGARPQQAEARVKPPRPSMKVRLRPQLSPSRPPVISRIA